MVMGFYVCDSVSAKLEKNTRVLCSFVYLHVAQKQ